MKIPRSVLDLKEWPRLPDAALSQHVITLGKTGAGKSSTMRLLVEDLLDIDRPVCVIDPKGDWWGIKLNRSGVPAGVLAIPSSSSAASTLTFR
jgi:DNA helicase HerA-like ATPase